MAEFKALIFDQDGVIADTERDGHRIAFNRAFKEFDLDIEWDVETYGGLLKVGGGKERMRHYLVETGMSKDIEDLDSLVKQLHKRKTDIFMEMIENGEMALRPGVKRLMTETHKAGVRLAVCSTSNERAVNTLTRTLLGEEVYRWLDPILAGDVVTEKKPSPKIYNLAKERMNLSPEDCVVVEDSRNGLLAAKGAGMWCIVTQNGYTRSEDFSEADIVLSCLGDPDGETAHVIASKAKLGQPDYISVKHIKKLFA